MIGLNPQQGGAKKAEEEFTCTGKSVGGHKENRVGGITCLPVSGLSRVLGIVFIS